MAMKNAIPLDWVYLSGEEVRFNCLMAQRVWNAVCDAGRDPETLPTKHLELGDGRLAIGFFEKETDDFKCPIKGLGFIIPMGFWSSVDGRMPINWIFKDPPAEYGPPGVGKPDKSIFNWTPETLAGSSNPF